MIFAIGLLSGACVGFVVTNAYRDVKEFKSNVERW